MDLSAQLKHVYEGRVEEILIGSRFFVVVGWILDKTSGAFPAKLDIYYDGQRISHRLTRSVRQDLIKAGKGDGNCAFSAYFELDIAFEPEKLVVSVDGDAAKFLVAAYTRVKPDYARGRLEGVNSRGRLFGWLNDQNVKEKVPAVLKHGDSELLQINPSLPRPDLKIFFYENDRVGFEVGLDALASALATRDPSLSFLGDKPTVVDLAYGGAVISSLSVTLDATIDGEIESVSNVVRGWAAWRLLPNLPVEVAVEVNGRSIGLFVAQSPRPDIRGRKAFGFEAPIPEDLLSGEKIVVSATVGPDRAHLRNSPRSLSRPVAPPASRNAERTHPPFLRRAEASAQHAPGPGRGAHQKTTHAPTRAPTHGHKKKAAVIAWDMGHNPAGRAYLLADMVARHHNVELIGPMFSRYGGKLWGPIADSSMSIRAFKAERMRDLLEEARKIASSTVCDVVYVSKPRLPSLLLGALIKLANNCPMVVDVDDHELSFFPTHTPIDFENFLAGAQSDPDAADTPYSELWTRLCETLVASADSVTVSNIALQRKFGGIVVRHGRDETLFNPAHYDRESVRKAFGFSPEDRVVLFLGTPRPHKGIFTIADAMERVDAPNLKLCIIGSITDKRISDRIATYRKAKISLHPDQPWSSLPKLVQMADLVPILQDPESPVSEFQIPAKLTDALAMAAPVAATPVPPLQDLLLSGAIRPIATDDDFDAVLRELSEGTISPQSGQVGRNLYLSEFTYSLNAARIQTAFDRAAESKSDMRGYDDVLDFLEERTGVSLERFGAAERRKARLVRFAREKRPRDMVFLWKQNDSGIYGRRSDMMVKYLGESGRIGKILHLDAPISGADLQKQIPRGGHSIANQGNLVVMNTMKRFLKMNGMQQTFVYRSADVHNLLGVKLPEKEEYPAFIAKAMEEAGIGPDPILWVCPVVFDLKSIVDVVKPGLIVADIIDDQRKFSSNEKYNRLLQQAYEEALAQADLVYCNCEPVQEGFANQRPDIRMVPNGAEIFEDVENWPAPDALRGLPRPIIGYVGNLRDRVDLKLIRKVAESHPDKSVVLIGSAHNFPEALALDELPNVHFLGVRPYDEAVRFIRHFDVAMMPHLVNDVSNHMNPLKLYVYFALGVPIVTTDVANIDEIGPYALVASDHAQFLEKVDEVLAGNGVKIDNDLRLQVMAGVSWQARLKPILRDMGFDDD